MGYKLRKADFFSESAVYGLIMVSALLMVTDRYDVTSRDVFIKVLITVAVFWLAHLFATGVARLSHVPDRKSPIHESMQYALVHSLGMLIAAVLPLAIVLLGVINLIGDEIALWTALWVDVVLLGVLGYVSAGSWTQKLSQRLTMGSATALLGVGIVLLKALIH
ncbi:hypothetical protein [Pseudarthrobacter sp. PS3-L1]|uniref:hypothetical protein n=1 Tax=Pseudarthrobacter sp. PS3-L1 TaxID=3046207 RepID=UPI0024BB6085|nr:hypothetical protein [Pseudarthrobacter sp. PS3-L1]MDJ0321928.1 hypothetical protein [Pseudarthrobacter sp. PS3-L1]